MLGATRCVEGMTAAIKTMTKIITVATIMNVLVAALGVYVTFAKP